MNLDPEKFIEAIRSFFGSSIAIYTMGNCYQFHKILKQIFPKAIGYYDGNHVWTKIDDKYYDIRGINKSIEGMKGMILIEEDKDLMESLSVNEWTDERRRNYGNKKI